MLDYVLETKYKYRLVLRLFKNFSNNYPQCQLKQKHAKSIFHNFGEMTKKNQFTYTLGIILLLLTLDIKSPINFHIKSNLTNAILNMCGVIETSKEFVYSTVMGDQLEILNFQK